MITLDSQVQDSYMQRQSSPGFYGSSNPHSVATMQRRQNFGSLVDIMWCQDENDVSLSNMTISRPNELVSEHARSNMPSFHRENFQGQSIQQSMPARHMSSHWSNPSSGESSSPHSNPSINITPPPLDEHFSIPSFGDHYSRNMSSPSMSSAYDLSPQYSQPELPYHDASFHSVDVSMPEKLTADWVQQVNQVSFEPVIIDTSGQDIVHSGSMHWHESQHPSELQVPHSGAQLWSNPRWAAMYSQDSSTSRSLTPIDHSCYLSTNSSPFSSAPQSPALREYFSLSPLTTPSLSRRTTPELKHSSTMTKGKICSHCRATSTPLWRRDPRTQQQLCNACGLYLQQRGKLRPQQLIDADADEPLETSYDPNAPECSHCHTRNTSVWRRSKDGAQLCNACGVYRRLRGKDRPLSLRRNRIKPRTKHNTA